MMAPADRSRAPNLSEDDVAAIVEILDGWAGPLTWMALIARIESRLFANYRRQTLSKHTAIRQAFANKKVSLGATSTDTPRRGSAELQKALERIARLEATNQRLSAENNALLEQFVRWAYNAHLTGLDEEFLNRPILPVGRR